MLYQKVAEGDSAQPLQAVVNGIEHGRVGLLQRQHRGIDVQKCFKIADQSAGERHFDEDHRFGRKCRLEKGKATAVCFHPAAQVRPAADLMNGLILNQLLQRQSRRLPINALQAQEATVEPGPK